MNKTELFGFLSQQVICIPADERKNVYTTQGKMVLCSPAQCDVTNLTHVLTRKQTHAYMPLHASGAVQKGCNKMTIRTVDTNVVVLAVAMLGRSSQRKCGLLLVVEPASDILVFMK